MITTPAYSFVQFNPADPQLCCNGINSVCLPVVAGTDLKFQIISDSAISTLQVVRMNGDVVSSNSGFVYKGNRIYDWQSPIVLTGLSCDECFQLKIGTALSNCFIKKCDDCFTSILEYSNDEDYAGFKYCDTEFVNRVRLPMFLSKPKVSEDRAVYRRSNGVIKLTKSLLTKEYVVQTDFMTEAMHDSLAVALAHDTVTVFSSAYSGVISKSSDYNLPWDDDMCLAQADFKVAVSPFAIRNNNCQECGSATVECGDITSLNGTAQMAPVACAEISSLNGSAQITPVACADISSLNGSVGVDGGLITLFNDHTTTGNRLESVSPFGWTSLDGFTTIVAGGSKFGNHGDFSGNLVVDATLTIDSRVELYINGTLVNCSGHVGTGAQSYSLTNLFILASDQVEIHLVPGDVCQ